MSTGTLPKVKEVTKVEDQKKNPNKKKRGTAKLELSGKRLAGKPIEYWDEMENQFE